MNAASHPIAVFYDGAESPTYRLVPGDTWRPARGDMSWCVLDQRTGQVVEEYHPPRHAIPSVRRIPITPFATRS